MENREKTIRHVVTKENLKSALESVGVTGNMILEVHTSLSSLGYVIGGARTVVDALMEMEEDGGTILMPTQTPENSDPSTWVNPPVSPSTWNDIRDNTPEYDPERSDVSAMGSVVNEFRHRNGIVFSMHPQYSYAAWGRYAKLLCNRQSLHFPLAEESPAARIYELKGYILLIGTDLSSATCLHLAEYRSSTRPIVIESSSTLVNGRRTWKKYLNLDLNSDDFNRVEDSLIKKGLIREVRLNGCRIQLIAVSNAVDEVTNYLEQSVVYDLYR